MPNCLLRRVSDDSHREIEFAQARIVIDAIADELIARNGGAAVAVVDPHGELVAFIAAMDALLHRSTTQSTRPSLPPEKAFRPASWESGREMRVFLCPTTVTRGTLAGEAGSPSSSTEASLVLLE